AIVKRASIARRARIAAVGNRKSAATPRFASTTPAAVRSIREAPAALLPDPTTVDAKTVTTALKTGEAHRHGSKWNATLRAASACVEKCSWSQTRARSTRFATLDSRSSPRVRSPHSAKRSRAFVCVEGDL